MTVTLKKQRRRERVKMTTTYLFFKTGWVVLMEVAEVGKGTGLQHFVLDISVAVNMKNFCEPVVAITGLKPT